MRPKRYDIFKKAYASAKRDAAAETNLPIGVFPLDPPFDVDDVANATYWP